MWGCWASWQMRGNGEGVAVAGAEPDCCGPCQGASYQDGSGLRTFRLERAARPGPPGENGCPQGALHLDKRCPHPPHPHPLFCCSAGACCSPRSATAPSATSGWAPLPWWLSPRACWPITAAGGAPPLVRGRRQRQQRRTAAAQPAAGIDRQWPPVTAAMPVRPLLAATLP